MSTPIWESLEQVEMCLGSPPIKVQLQYIIGAKFTTLAEKERVHMRSRSSIFQGGRGRVSFVALNPERLVAKKVLRGNKVKNVGCFRDEHGRRPGPATTMGLPAPTNKAWS